MTPYFRLIQVALAETAFAMPIKYSSQSGLNFFLFFMVNIIIAYRLASLQASYIALVRTPLIYSISMSDPYGPVA